MQLEDGIAKVWGKTFREVIEKYLTFLGPTSTFITIN